MKRLQQLLKNKNNGQLIYKFVRMNILVVFKDVLGPFVGNYVPTLQKSTSTFVKNGLK